MPGLGDLPKGAIFERAVDAVFVADLDGRYIDVNPAACRLLGHPREALLGRTIADLIPAEELPRLAAVREQLLAGAEHLGRWRLQHADGHFVAVELTAAILADGRWIAFVRDITDREGLEAALHRRDEELREAQAIAHLGSWRLDLVDDELAWSDEACRIFGAPPGTCTTYAGFLERVHPADRARVDAAWQAALQGAPYEIEHRVVVDGDERWVVERAALERDAEGRVTHGIGTTLDVTARRRAEAELRESEARLAAIVSLSSNGIISVDADQRITLLNRAAEGMFGWRESEVAGRPLDVLIPGRYRARHRESVRGFAVGPTDSRRMNEHVAVVGLRRTGEEFAAEGGILRAGTGPQMRLTVILSDRTREERALADERFLGDVGSVLASSLDLEVTAARVCQLAARFIADVCVLDVVEAGRPVRLRVAVNDQDLRDVAKRLENFPVDRDRPHMAGRALKRAEPEVIEHVTDQWIESVAQSEEHLRLLRELAPRSFIGMPLRARGHVRGALLLLSRTRGFGPRDLRLAAELASRAAVALDNALLMRELERANTDLRATVDRLTAAQESIEALTGLLPVCAWCRRIRDDDTQAGVPEWKSLEQYLDDHATGHVTHGICPSCAAEQFPGVSRSDPRQGDRPGDGEPGEERVTPAGPGPPGRPSPPLRR